MFYGMRTCASFTITSRLMDATDIIRLLVEAAYLLTVAGSILVVISENQHPFRTLAWVLILTFVPLFGIILYYVLGQGTRQRKYFRSYRAATVDGFPAAPSLAANRPLVAYAWQGIVSLLATAPNAWVLRGSRVEVITSGEEKFNRLAADLSRARHHIHMEYFLFNNDATGRAIKDILMRKAEEGVEVRFIYENIANITVSRRFYEEMGRSGVHVSAFSKLRLSRIRRTVNYRNHRKAVVIDGHTGYIGGMNIGDEYRTDHWRDTHLRIEGQGVYGLQANFLSDWASSGEPLPADLAPYFPPAPVVTDNLLQIASGGPDSPHPTLLHATVGIITASRRYIYIQTPYFLPTESLAEALYSAAVSGVDVRLMVSARSDTRYVDPAARSYYEDLLAAGVRIFEHQSKFIHAKTLVADDYISMIGSTNMDFRSFEASFEMNCYLYDPALASRNKAIFLDDMEGCREVLLSEWERRPMRRRFVESFMRLFAPLM